MKCYSIPAAILALTSTVSAMPAKRQNSCIVQSVMDPGVNGVRASITQWDIDVKTVNKFLNAAPGLIGNTDALLSQTKMALTNAQDEPCQLMTLASQKGIIGVPAFDCAVQDLMNVFEVHVLDNLNQIISTPDDTRLVQAAIDDVNAFRCCNVLPDVDILFLDSADEKGISNTVATSVPRENACANIQCQPKCKKLNNGSNGK